MDIITFTSFQLIIGDSFPDLRNFHQLIQEALTEYHREGVHYTIEHFVDNEQDIYCICSCYGNPLPYSEQVYDTVSNTSKDNPRNPYDAELRNQFFGLYDFKSQLLYLSNSQKKSFFEIYCKTYLGKEVIIKRIYKTADEFLSIVDTIRDIRLVSHRSIFSVNTKLFDETGNIFGLGDPNQFKLDIDFGKVKKTKIFEQILKQWRDKFTDCEVEQLICAGYDDKNMEVIFNTDSFMNKIELKLNKNANGMFNKDEVLSTLLGQIRSVNV